RLLSLHVTTSPRFFTLSLHDALPIFDQPEPDQLRRSQRPGHWRLIPAFAQPGAATQRRQAQRQTHPCAIDSATQRAIVGRLAQRSEEHTSELQSRENLVCRLLLEKKK